MEDDWHKPRSQGQHLSEADIAQMLRAFNEGRPARDIARDLKCSRRIATKYYAKFRGYAQPRGGRQRRAKIEVVQPARPALPSRFYKSNFEL